MAETAEGNRARTDYQHRLATVAVGLRRLADDVERIGKPGVLHDGRPDHCNAAMAVQARVLGALDTLGLDVLVWAAMAADHPTARLTPGQLLDKAIDGAEAYLNDGPELIDTHELADAVLRGAGLL